MDIFMAANKDSLVVEHIKPEEIKNIGRTEKFYKIDKLKINSPESDFGPTYYKDSLVFSSARNNFSSNKKYKWTDQNFLKLYSGKIKDDGNLEGLNYISNKFGKSYMFHEGPVCFSKDGTEVYITRNTVSKGKRAVKSKNGVVKIKLYYSKFDGNRWSKPKLMPFNLKDYSTGHPSISENGKDLYFVSDRPGGIGGTDIYVSHKINGVWTEPTNLGPRVNTIDNEMFPFISQSGVLFFSSKGHAGLGGLDIFSFDTKDITVPVMNLGIDINSTKDDFGLIINDDKGYFSSNREKGESFDDIYMYKINSFLLNGIVKNIEDKSIIQAAKVSYIDTTGVEVTHSITTETGWFGAKLGNDREEFTITASKPGYSTESVQLVKADYSNRVNIFKTIYLKPVKDIILNGLVAYKSDNSPVKMVNIEIIDTEQKDTIKLSTADTGKFTHKLLRDKKYEINIWKEKTISCNELVYAENNSQDTINIVKYIDKLEVGKSFVLENIFYDFDKDNIRPDAAIELDKLVKIMEENPSLKIELSSHTDSRGSDVYNIDLSDRRAKSAVAYIISKGINPDRLIASGYGETRLVNRCSDGVSCSRAEHQANRRTEIKILEL
jgi:outer membrane protein OmpA-like peptidoglycan-associated protein